MRKRPSSGSGLSLHGPTDEQADGRPVSHRTGESEFEPADDFPALVPSIFGDGFFDLGKLIPRGVEFCETGINSCEDPFFRESIFVTPEEFE